MFMSHFAHFAKFRSRTKMRDEHHVFTGLFPRLKLLPGMYICVFPSTLMGTAIAAKKIGELCCHVQKKRRKQRLECGYLPRVPILTNATPAGASVATVAATRTTLLLDMGLRD